MTEREMFEDFLRKNKYKPEKQNGRYTNLVIAIAWMAWQARAKLEETKSRGSNV